MPNVTQGTQKVLFAYQLKPSIANVLNPYIAGASSEIVVRIEWPASGNFAAINNPSLEDVAVADNAGASVRPVMAIPIGAKRYAVRNVGNSPGVGAGSFGNYTYDYQGQAIAHRIITWATVHAGYPRQGIDIVIPGGSDLYNDAVDELLATVYLKVLVNFSDGSQDDLWVRLMPPENCRLSLNDEPPQFDKAFGFEHVGVPNSSDEYTGIATYNISKAYVGKPKGESNYQQVTGSIPSNTWYSISRKKLTEDHLENVQFLTDDIAYTPYAQPWGAIVFSNTSQPYSGLLNGWDTSDPSNFAANNYDPNGNGILPNMYGNANLSVPGNWARDGYTDSTPGSGGLAPSSVNYLNYLILGGPNYTGPAIQNVRYFTRQHSFLTFVTGQWDNTWIYRGYDGQPSYAGAKGSLQNFQNDVINLNNFFGISPQSNYAGDNPEPLGESSWGLKYGWLGWTGSTGLYRNGLANDPVRSMWGIPMFWARNNAVPFTRINQFADSNPEIYALNPNVSTGWGFDAAPEASAAFYGKHINNIQSGDGVDGTQNISQSGFFGTVLERDSASSVPPLFSDHFERDNAAVYGATNFNNPLFGTNIIPPQSMRWSRLTGAMRPYYWSGFNLLTTQSASSRAPGIKDGAGGSGGYLSVFARLYNSADGNAFLKTQVGLGFGRDVYQPFGTNTAVVGTSSANNQLSQGGSLHDIRMNIGRNFFYTGGRYLSDDEDFVVPVFKGIIRTLYITNTNQWPSGEGILDRLRWKLNAMGDGTNFEAGLISANEVGGTFASNTTFDSSKNPVSYLDFYGVYHALDTSDGQNPHSPWDLYASLIFSGHTYGNSGQAPALTGLNAELYNNLIGGNQYIGGSPNGLADAEIAVKEARKAFKNGDPMDENGISKLFANDISFMLYGYAPVKDGIAISGDYQNERYSLVTNHPVGSTYKEGSVNGLPQSLSLENSDSQIITDYYAGKEGSTPFLLSVGNVNLLNDNENGSYGNGSTLGAVFPYPYSTANGLGSNSSYPMDLAAPNMTARTQTNDGDGNDVFTASNNLYKGQIIPGSYINYHLPTYQPFNLSPFDKGIIAAGTDECLVVSGMYNIISNQSTEQSTWNQNGNLSAQTGAGYPIYDSGTLSGGAFNFEGAQGLGFRFLMRYENSCTGEFETDDGSKIANSGTVDARLAKVLEMFGHIEYSPLSQLSPAGVNQYSYKVVLEDADDVDNISVTETAPGKYQLLIEIVADDDDVYDNPAEVDVELDAANTDIFPDIFPENSSTLLGNSNAVYGSAVNAPGIPSKWRQAYGLYKASEDSRPESIGYSGFKGSFITIAYSSSYYEDLENYTTTAGGGDVPAYNQITSAGQLKMKDRHIFHMPFLNYGYIDEEVVDDIVESIIEGCTDSSAPNYNPDATTNDGSCQDCSDLYLGSSLDFNATQATSASSPFQALRFGMVRHGGFQFVGGDNSLATIQHPDNNTTASYFPGGLPETEQDVFITSPGSRRGGIILCDNHVIGEVAEWAEENDKPKFVVEVLNTGAGLQMNDILSLLEDGGDDYTAWRLRIRVLTDGMINDGSIDWSNPIYNGGSGGDTPDSLVDTSTIIFNSLATGGTIQAPEWTNIATLTDGVYKNTNILAGQPYLFQLGLEATGCDDDLGDLSEFVLNGIFWTGICSCASVGNDYYFAALANFEWAWNLSGGSFPIFSLTTDVSTAASQNYKCTTTSNSNGLQSLNGVNGALGDGPFIGVTVSDNSSICYQIDDELTSCELFVASCALEGNLQCINVGDLPDGPPYDLEDLATNGYIVSTGPDAYQFGYADGYITTQIDGMWNPFTNSYQFNPNMTYTVSLTTPSGEVITQSQNEASNSGGEGFPDVWQNTFEGLSEEGDYLITITILNPYPEAAIEAGIDAPCTYTHNVFLTAECPDVILGCTDPASSTYNPAATIDDGTCDDGGCGEEIISNPVFDATVTSVNMESVCELVEVVVGGQVVQYEVPVPNTSTGSITVTVDYTPDIYAVDSFAVVLGIPGGQSLYSFVNSYLDSLALTFQSYPDANVENPIVIDGVGYWSPLQYTNPGQSSYTVTFENAGNMNGGLIPGTYYVLVVPNLPNISDNLADCTTADILLYESSIQTTTITMNPPEDDCIPPCLDPGDDGLCDPWNPGCTDPEADNYDEDATIDDGSCEEPPSFCDDNPDDEDCIDCTDAQENLPASGRYKYKTGRVEEIICDPTTGSEGECTDPNACNYNPDAPLDASNNLICDYCSCTDPIDDPDCITGEPCDPAVDVECQQTSICPDPENPECDPVISNPCPTPDDCEPPPPPCVILGNCPEEEETGEITSDPPVLIIDPPVEVPCTFAGQAGGFSIVQEQAFQCMSDEGKRLMFRLKAGSQYEREDIIKLSLISYLFMGGLEGNLLDCLFNCDQALFNDSKQRSMVKDCQADWLSGGGRIWNGNDGYTKGNMVLYNRLKQGTMTQNFYIAERDIAPLGLHPGLPQSGWKRCYSYRLQTKTNVATGDEKYLQTFYEFMTRMCTACSVENTPTQTEPTNLIDPKKLDNYLNPKDNSNGDRLSGILGADGQEIII